MISVLGSTSEIIPLDDCSSIILLYSASNSGSFFRRFKTEFSCETATS